MAIQQVYVPTPVERNIILQYRWKVLYGVATLGEAEVMEWNGVELDFESTFLEHNLDPAIIRLAAPWNHTELEGSSSIADPEVDPGDEPAAVHFFVEAEEIDHEGEDSPIVILLDNIPNGHRAADQFVSTADFHRNFVSLNLICTSLHREIGNVRYH